VYVHRVYLKCLDEIQTEIFFTSKQKKFISCPEISDFLI